MLRTRLSQRQLAWQPARVLALPAWVRLSVLGGLSTGVAWLGLVQPYNLFALRLAPLRSLAKLTTGEPWAQAGFVLTLAALSGLYYLAWRVCRAAGQDPAARRSAWLALAGSLAALNLAAERGPLPIRRPMLGWIPLSDLGRPERQDIAAAVPVPGRGVPGHPMPPMPRGDPGAEILGTFQLLDDGRSDGPVDLHCLHA